MRRPAPAKVARTAAALGAIALLATVGGGVLAQAALPTGFPTTRIKLDPASQQVNVSPSASASLTASVVDWNDTALPGIKVQLKVLSGPDAGQTTSGTTNKQGQVALTVKSTGGPGTDSVQASFSDGLEIHKSNRPVVNWLGGRTAQAIASPATLSVTPDCYQPLNAAGLTSDQFAGPLPSPSASAAPPPPYSITVKGDNFNPFTAVLVTFDAGQGGHAESFQAKTDGFGHFVLPISPSARAEGVHLVRADDFREREANANFTVPCFQPSLALNPAIGPPGYVPIAYGAGYPKNSPLVLFAWDTGITSSVICLGSNGLPILDSSGLPKTPATDANGAFRCEVLVLFHDILGPRMLRAIVANPEGPNAGAGIEADAPFFVTPGRAQPPDFTYRR